jgi:hypothetical protein
MARRELIDRILADALRRYWSFESPEFHFLQPALENTPLRQLTLKLRDNNILVTEDTDANDDVSLGFFLESEDDKLFLQESLVGPYAVLRRVKDDNSVDILDYSQKGSSDLVNIVLDFLNTQNITLLDRSILEVKCPIKLSNTEMDESNIYNVLFSDTEIGM